MMRKAVFICISLVLAVQGHAQQHSSALADSLWQVLQESKEDTLKIEQYLQFGSLFEGHNPDSAAYYYQLAGSLSDKLKHAPGQVRYIAYYTELLNRHGKYDEALALNRKAVKIAQENNLQLQLAKAYVNVGVSYQYKAQYEQTLQYYLKGLAIFEALNFETGIYMLYSNLSGLYGDELQQYDKALFYGDKAVALAREQNNQQGIAMAQLNRGLALTKQKKFEEALPAIQEGYSIGLALNNIYIKMAALGNMGDIYLQQRQYAAVIPKATEMLTLAKTVADVDTESLALSGLASAYLNTHQFEKARECARQAVALCQEHNLREEWGRYLLLLANAELALGNLAAYERYQLAGDSLSEVVLNEKMVMNLQELETKYETAKKVSQIEQLQHQNQIQELSLRQKNILHGVFIGSIVALLALGFLYYRNTRHKKFIYLQTQKLQEQRIKELEQAQRLLAVDAMLKGQEAERSRLAKDLHDGLGGMLSGIKLSLSALEGNMLLQAPDALSFSRALNQLDSTIRELRRVAHNMMSESLIRWGLVRALQNFCHGLQQASQLEIQVQVFGMEERLDSNTEIILYRIVQELLNNIVKHAGASEVLVQLIRSGDYVTLTVEDNGKGFDVSQSPSGIGLSNIRSRVDYLGGNLDITSSPQVGTTVNIDFTLETVGVKTGNKLVEDNA